MFGYKISWHIFTFTLFELIIHTHLIIHDNSHGFISNNQRLFDNDLTLLHTDISSEPRSAVGIDDGSSKLQLRFEPVYLDFKHRPLGVPHLEKVTLFNIDNNKTIDMTSISGSTIHFHSSFFEDKKIPPLGNTSFNVVFVGREEGTIESDLFIHTTDGYYKYTVKAATIYSPYRLRPLIGIKLGINTTFTPTINIYNPHSYPIQVMEMYSSGHDFHLELPTGEEDAPKDIWEIPPYHHKSIINVQFQAKIEQNHTAYIRIRINNSDEMFVVPIEIEVAMNGGIYHPQGYLDFGVGGSLDKAKFIDLCVINPMKRTIKIQSITTKSNAIKINLIQTKLSMNGKCVKIATLQLDWLTAFKTNDYSGKITIKYRNNKYYLDIPYYISVIDGGINYDQHILQYFINDQLDNLLIRNFSIKNNYLSNVKLINLTLSDDVQQYFMIDNFKPITMKSMEKSEIFTIRMRKNLNLKNFYINSFIYLKTNISDHAISILSYDGKLKTVLPFNSNDYSLNLGLISLNSRKICHLLLYNKNPVLVKMKNLKSSINSMKIDIIGCSNGSYDNVLMQITYKNLTKCTQLKSDDYAILRLTVQTGQIEGHQWGDIQIETTYENLSIPIQFKMAAGRLEIGTDQLFDDCFPGKICTQPIRIHSTFNEPMLIENILPIPFDERITSNHTNHIMAHTKKVVGHLYLDPTIKCGNNCYTGLNQDLMVEWLKTLTIPNDTLTEFDLNLINLFYNRYQNVTDNGVKKIHNLTFRLDTNQVRGHLFRSKLVLNWPSLFDNTNIKFPLTQIGNITYKNITIKNPTNHHLFIQIIFDRNYPNFDGLYDGLPEIFSKNFPGKLSKTLSFFFHQNLSELHNETITMILTPNGSEIITIGFYGSNTIKQTTFMVIRNNLTVIELVRLEGQGTYPAFKFGNRKPGSLQPLYFELTDKQMKDCDDMERLQKIFAPNLTIKRTFSAKNTGDIPIYVRKFLINDLQCEGYGFKIINCEPFNLKPNETRKIDIAFTPDLTLTKIQRQLVMETSLNVPIKYLLNGIVPTTYMAACANLLARPYWENGLRMVSGALMVVMFTLICLLAYLDADRLKCLHQNKFTTNHTTESILDLRMIGEQIRHEIHTKDCLNQKLKQQKNIRKKLPKNNRTDDILMNDNLKKMVQRKKMDDGKKCDHTKKMQMKKMVKHFEEETSSTTTESSCNNDEEKEHEIKSSTHHIYEQNKMQTDLEDEDFVIVTLNKAANTKKSKDLLGQKKLKETTKADLNLKICDKKQMRNKDRKDRINPKKLNEKSLNRHELKTNGNVRVSPPTISSVWNENRATFSDVVARNDNNNHPITMRTQTSKPTMYVEPYKQTPSTTNMATTTISTITTISVTNIITTTSTTNTTTITTTLGPIGSRPGDMHSSTTNENVASTSAAIAAAVSGANTNTTTNTTTTSNCDSFFSSLTELANNPTFVDDEYWNRHNLANFLEYSQNQTGYRDPWCGDNYWNTPFGGDSAASYQQTGYLWGSSSVWQPWAPTDPPKTPARRTPPPPGFDRLHQRKRDDQSSDTNRDSYSPFGVNSNIWSPPNQQPNPWNYPGQ